MLISRNVSILCAAASLLHAQTPSTEATLTRMAKVQTCLPPPIAIKDDSARCPTLQERMQQLHVPGVSIAVVHNGIIDWAAGFGVQQVGGKGVTPETMFQAGSISKPIAAMAVLRLVQQGKLSLDSDVNGQLTSWKIPPNNSFPGAIVTLRELLTHTAGITVHGFPGYAAAETVPTLVQVLNGEKPANTPPIRLESAPGSKWNYSGGGYTIMQQLVLDVAKEPFPKLLHDTVFSPIGMKHSTEVQPLPADYKALPQHLIASPANPSKGAHTLIRNSPPPACGPLLQISPSTSSRIKNPCKAKRTMYSRLR